jgi:hypothetical protein
MLQHLSEKDIAGFVQNGKTTVELEANDTGSDLEDSGDDSCAVVVPKLSKVLQNINELMTWVEQQTDSEHLHLLHPANIKQCVLRKCSH